MEYAGFCDWGVCPSGATMRYVPSLTDCKRRRFQECLQFTQFSGFLSLKSRVCDLLFSLSLSVCLSLVRFKSACNFLMPFESHKVRNSRIPAPTHAHTHTHPRSVILSFAFVPTPGGPGTGLSLMNLHSRNPVSSSPCRCRETCKTNTDLF